MNAEEFTAQLDEGLSKLQKIFRKKRVSEDDIQDILQDAALAAWRNWRQLREDTAFQFWLARIGNNCRSTYYRGRRRTEELQEWHSVTRPDEGVDELARKLARERCTPDERRLLQRIHEGYTVAQIARQNGESYTRTRRRVLRAAHSVAVQMGLTLQHTRSCSSRVE